MKHGLRILFRYYLQWKFNKDYFDVLKKPHNTYLED